MARGLTFTLFLAIPALCAASAACGGPTQPSSLSVTSLSPNAGTVLGATRVILYGAGFKPGITVQFGGSSAAVEVLSPNAIAATTPAHSAGVVSVAVTNRDEDSVWIRSAYIYKAEADPEPTITISGVITDVTDDAEAPLQGVAVTESATHKTVYSDATGAYRLVAPRRTDLTIWMGKPGYDTVTTIVTSQSDVRLDARMKRYPVFVLSGLVYELTPNGRVPLSGVVLYCEYCSEVSGQGTVTTGADGLYSFRGVRNGKTWIDSVTKDGYRYTGPLELGSIPVFVDGNTKFDIELVKR